MSVKRAKASMEEGEERKEWTRSNVKDPRYLDGRKYVQSVLFVSSGFESTVMCPMSYSCLFLTGGEKGSVEGWVKVREAN